MVLQAEGTSRRAGGGRSFEVTVRHGLGRGRVLGWYFLVTYLLDLFFGTSWRSRTLAAHLYCSCPVTQLSEGSGLWIPWKRCLF